MRMIYKKITYHSHMQNDRRLEIDKWLLDNCVFEEDRSNWAYVTSNYTEYGCFDVCFIGYKNEEAATLFGMTYPQSRITEVDAEKIYETTQAHFDSLFEIS